MSTTSIKNQLKYVETYDNKKPIKEGWRDEKNQVNDYKSLRSAALVIPNGIVVIDFDGDNINKNGIPQDEKIISYLLKKYKPYWTKSRKNHIHLYFRIPNGLEIKNWPKYMSLGGFQVDYKTYGGLAAIKIANKIRERLCELTSDILEQLPILPPICYPLYNNINKKNSLIDMVEGDGRDNAIFHHIGIATGKYPNIDLKEAILFINNLIFKEPMQEYIVLDKIKRAKHKYMDISNNYLYFKELDSFIQENDTKVLKLVCLDDIKAEQPKWIWYPYIPLGTIVLLVGDPGVGKTYIALWIASVLSNGGKFPFDYDNQNENFGPSNVIFQNGEDGVSYTLKQRLELLNADSKHIFMIDESDNMFKLDDLALFEESLKRLNPKLVIIDPIQRYIPDGKSMDKANDVRSALSPIRDLAEKYNCTIIIIMHRNKGSKSPSLYRALGSIDFVGTARSMLTVEEKNSIKYIKHDKSSMGVIGNSIQYEINNNGLEIIDVINPNELENNQDKKIEKAIAFLKSALKDGYMPSLELSYQAEEQEISKSTLKRAKKKLGIEVVQHDNRWYTCLNKEEAKKLEIKLKNESSSSE